MHFHSSSAVVHSFYFEILSDFPSAPILYNKFLSKYDISAEFCLLTDAGDGQDGGRRIESEG